MAFPEGIAYDVRSGRLFTGSSVDGTLYEGLTADKELTILRPANYELSVALGMGVSPDGQLYVMGGESGRLAVLDLDGSRAVTVKSPDPAPGDSSLLNDVAFDAEGTAYLTDSYRPVLFHYTRGESVTPWIDLQAAGVTYTDGFNLNGIVSTADGRFLLAVQSNTGTLYRISLIDRIVDSISVTGGTLHSGDGMALDNQELFVALNRKNAVVRLLLDEEYRTASVEQTYRDGFLMPTAVAVTADSLYVVNAQLNRRGSSEGPQLPFSISRLPR